MSRDELEGSKKQKKDVAREKEADQRERLLELLMVSFCGIVFYAVWIIASEPGLPVTPSNNIPPPVPPPSNVLQESKDRAPPPMDPTLVKVLEQVAENAKNSAAVGTALVGALGNMTGQFEKFLGLLPRSMGAAPDA